MKLGIIGLGCVGSAILKTFEELGIDVIGYDKYKNINTLDNLIDCTIIFLCLPTPMCYTKNEYDKTEIHNTCMELQLNKFSGLLVIKSTVEPMVTENLSRKYQLKFVHNPEFLSARSAYSDFKNQFHIVIGETSNKDQEINQKLIDLYKNCFPNADISLITSTESELMKLGVNNFYAVKVQFFNEIYCLSEKLGVNYNRIKNTMLKNKWINPMHTCVPGTDGKLSYGGMCFPKDTNALNEFMKKHNTYNSIIESTIDERNRMRNINKVNESYH